MNVNELEGVELDAAVAKCEGWFYDEPDLSPVPVSTDWSMAGPIIERETIELKPGNAAPNCVTWWARHPRRGWSTTASGPTPLIAAMRCYVASKQA